MLTQYSSNSVLVASNKNPFPLVYRFVANSVSIEGDGPCHAVLQRFRLWKFAMNLQLARFNASDDGFGPGNAQVLHVLGSAKVVARVAEGIR